MFQLAGHLGKSIREVERFDSEEISEWQAFNRIEPLPDLWYAAAIIAAANHNVTAGVFGGKGKARPTDYLPYRPQVRLRKQSMAEAKAIMSAVAAAQNARVARQGAA